MYTDLSFTQYSFTRASDDHYSLSSDVDSLPDSPELCSWVNDLGLSIADELTLIHGRWLTATHMSAANRLLCSQFPSQNGLIDTCVLKQNHMWSSTPDQFVQIIHVSSNHWACLSDKFSSPGSVDLFDSMHTVPVEGGTIVSQVCSILRTPKPTITTNVVNVCFQTGGRDCGLFAIAMAFDLCAGIDPINKEYVQSEMRNHLHSCFSNKLLQPFPSTVRNINKRTFLKVAVEVYCTCRRPEGDKLMVCCDGCNVWYHEGCVPIPTEVRNNESDEVPWQCPQCEKGNVIITRTYTE